MGSRGQLQPFGAAVNRELAFFDEIQLDLLAASHVTFASPSIRISYSKPPATRWTLYTTFGSTVSRSLRLIVREVRLQFTGDSLTGTRRAFVPRDAFAALLCLDMATDFARAMAGSTVLEDNRIMIVLFREDGTRPAWMLCQT